MTWKWGGDGSYIRIDGELIGARTAQQVVQTLQQNVLNGATAEFGVDGAEIGYSAGFGNVYDCMLSPPGGQLTHVRAIVEAAIRDGVAVSLVAVSPFTADQNHIPAPAQLVPTVEWAADVLGNAVAWKNEQPL